MNNLNFRNANFLKKITLATWITLFRVALVFPFLVSVQSGKNLIFADVLFVDGARLVAAENGNVILASWFGKIKTGLINSAIILLILSEKFPEILAIYYFSKGIILVALVFSAISGYQYIVQGFGIRKQKDH